MFTRRPALLFVLTGLLISTLLSTPPARALAPEAETGSISGHVYAAGSGLPIENASVSALDADFFDIKAESTDAGGYYQIEGLPCGQVHLVVSASGYGGVYYDNAYDDPGADVVTVVCGQDTPDIDFHLSAEATVSGHVTLADGVTPLAGAKVNVWPENGGQGHEATTAADGSYSVHRLATGSYVAKAAKAGFAAEFYPEAVSWGTATPFEVTQPENTPNIDFSLGEAGSISGHVYAAGSGLPIENAILTAFDSGFGEISNGGTDSSGYYQIEGLACGPVYLGVFALGYGGVYYDNAYDDPNADLVTVVCGQDTPDIDFHISTEATVSGHVTLADGVTPLAGAQVRVRPENGGQAWEATTAADGSYTVHHLSSGSYLARATKEGFVSESYPEAISWETATPFQVTQPGDTPGIDFTLDEPGSISVSVFQADGVTPIPNADVIVRNEDFKAPIGVFNTGAGSAVQVDGLTPGNYSLFAGADGYGSQFYPDLCSSSPGAPVQVAAGQVITHSFSLSPEGSISGHVYAADGVTPVSNATVLASAWEQGWMKMNNTTDSTGAYTISYLSTCTYSVRVLADGYVGEYYQDASSRDAAAPVSVQQPENTPGIDFTLGVTSTATLEPGGGTLSFGANELSLQAPAGTVTSTLSLTYTPLGSLLGPSNFAFAGTSFGLELSSGGSLAFSQPVTLTVSYSHADLGDLDESSLRLYTRPSDDAEWTDAANSCSPPSETVIDTAANTLSVAVCHLSTFALFAPDYPEVYLPMVIR